MPRAKSSQKATKSAGKSAASVPAKIPQPHGGALLSGGMPGNAGGGRPPDEIRARLRAIGFEKGLPFLDGLMDGKVLIQLACSRCGNTDTTTDTVLMEKVRDEIRASVDQRLKAMEQLFKYGLGTKDEMSVVSPDVQARVAQTVQVVSDTLPPEYAEPLLAKLSEVWR